MASKICIIGTSNLKHISLISLYTKFFNDNGIKFDLIYLDRYGINEESTAENIYRYTDIDNKGTLGKIRMFFRFRKYVLKILKKNRYDYIITWQTTGAYLFADILIRLYRKSYVVNIRDYVIEKNVFFRILLKKIIKNSLFVTISSEGFRTFLPKWEYIKVNSINEDLLNNLKVKYINNKTPIKIGFVGNCRYFRESFKLIDSLANDKNFELWFCGTNSDVLNKYASSKAISNVKTLPTFNPSMTINIMDGFDIINSAFGNDSTDNSTLIPIRLYTALAIHRPVLVSSNTQLAYEVKKWGIGFVIEDYSNLSDKLYSYYKSLDYNTFSKICDNYLNIAREENELFYSELNKMK